LNRTRYRPNAERRRELDERIEANEWQMGRKMRKQDDGSLAEDVCPCGDSPWPDEPLEKVFDDIRNSVEHHPGIAHVNYYGSAPETSGDSLRASCELCFEDRHHWAWQVNLAIYQAGFEAGRECDAEQ